MRVNTITEDFTAYIERLFKLSPASPTVQKLCDGVYLGTRYGCPVVVIHEDNGVLDSRLRWLSGLKQQHDAEIEALKRTTSEGKPGHVPHV